MTPTADTPVPRQLSEEEREDTATASGGDQEKSTASTTDDGLATVSDAERERITALGFQRAEVVDGRLEMQLTLSQEMAVILAGNMMQLLESHGAENYVEMQLRVPDRPEMVTLTVQRWMGKTPHQCRQAAEAEVARLTAERDALLTALSSEREAGERDKARLDWMQDRAAYATPVFDMDPEAEIGYTVTSDDLDYGEGATLRDAIDAARRTFADVMRASTSTEPDHD